MIETKLPNWQPDERMILLLRRHPWVMLRTFVFFLFIVAVPLVAYLLMRISNPDFFNAGDKLRTALLTVGASLYALMAWLFLFTAWVDYYLDVWILTSERIVSMEQHGLFSRTTAEQRLSRIQDVSTVQKGKTATFLNFGNVHVQTAGAVQQFIFEQVRNPERIAQQVMEAHDAWVQAHPEMVQAAQSVGVSAPAGK